MSTEGVGLGGQKKTKFSQRSLWTTPNQKTKVGVVKYSQKIKTKYFFQVLDSTNTFYKVRPLKLILKYFGFLQL